MESLESLESLVLRNRSNILANFRDDQGESTVAENKKRKKMNLGSQPQSQKIEVEVRNWLDLPLDVLSIIFRKLGALDIVYRAQSVCSVWRNLSKQPHFFRFIKMSHSPWYFGSTNINIMKIEKQIIDRSCGQLVGLSMVIYDTEEVLHYALDKPNSLKCLQVSRVSPDGLMKAITNVPFLEKLALYLDSSNYYSPKHVIAEISRSCSQLKYFFWCTNDTSYFHIRDHGEYEDEEVLAIAEYMPQLRELRLNWNVVTNKGMLAILHGCPYLEYLNLENCYYTTDLSEETLNRCRERIKTLKLPARYLWSHQ